MAALVCESAIAQLDKHEDECCSGSMLRFKVWMITGMAMSTAAYDLFCIFLVTRLIGRDRYQDNPFTLQHLVKPGRIPIGSLGILLAISFFGAFLGQILITPLADRYGRKLLFEVCLLVMIITSSLSAFSFSELQVSATGPNIVGSLCVWRLFLGIAAGGIYPLSASLMAEYAPKYTRGLYVSLVGASQGFGIAMAAFVTMTASAAIDKRYPGKLFPTQVTGCATFTELDTNGINPGGGWMRIFPCPTVNQQSYVDDISRSAPLQIEYIWRAVVSAGAFGALMALIFSRIYLVETARFRAFVEHAYADAITELAQQSPDVDFRGELAEVLDVESPYAMYPEETVDEETRRARLKDILSRQAKGGVNANIDFWEFWRRFRSPLLSCMVSWFAINMAFVGLLIILEEVAKYMGFNITNYIQPAAQESYGLGVTYLAACVVALIPGFYFASAASDVLGRKSVQFFGFLFSAVWCAACAGSFFKLLDPNNPDTNNYKKTMSGWMVMFVLISLFASFGPLTTVFVVSSEIFPTAWRVTGMSICAAAGSLGSITGVFTFIFAVQPAVYETTYLYPCTRRDEPSDFLSYQPDTCQKVNNCPAGRWMAPGDTVGSKCSVCLSDSLSGCYPFGLGVQGVLAIMVPTLMCGALATMFLPVTQKKSLEDNEARYQPIPDKIGVFTSTMEKLMPMLSDEGDNNNNGSDKLGGPAALDDILRIHAENDVDKRGDEGEILSMYDFYPDSSGLSGPPPKGSSKTYPTMNNGTIAVGAGGTSSSKMRNEYDQGYGYGNGYGVNGDDDVFVLPGDGYDDTPGFQRSQREWEIARDLLYGSTSNVDESLMTTNPYIQGGGMNNMNGMNNGMNNMNSGASRMGRAWNSPTNKGGLDLGDDRENNMPTGPGRQTEISVNLMGNMSGSGSAPGGGIQMGMGQRRYDDIEKVDR